MDLTKLKLKTVMYSMQSFVINAGGESFSVPSQMIGGIDIEKSFDVEIYPMWYICVNVPLWFYKKITKNSRDITVSMNLQYRLAPSSENQNFLDFSPITEISGIFKAVVPYTTQLEDATIQKQESVDMKEYNKNYTYNEYAMIELNLYNAKAYNASFDEINAILSSANVTDAFAYCVTKAGMSNVLMSKSDNNKLYSEFKILPQSTIMNMLRIVEDYKFHSNGSILFFDLVDSYLITKKIGCYAWKNNEYKTTQIISVTEFSEAMSQFGGIYIDTQEKINILAINKDSFVSKDLDGAPQFKNSGGTEYIIIETKSAIFSVLTPNKEFVVNFDTPDNKKFNGKYRIYKLECKMVPSGELLEPTFTITLRR